MALEGSLLYGPVGHEHGAPIHQFALKALESKGEGFCVKLIHKGHEVPQWLELQHVTKAENVELSALFEPLLLHRFTACELKCGV